MSEQKKEEKLHHILETFLANNPLMKQRLDLYNEEQKAEVISAANEMMKYFMPQFGKIMNSVGSAMTEVNNDPELKKKFEEGLKKRK